MAAALCTDVAWSLRPSGNHRVDSASTHLVGDNTTRLQCVEPSTASLVKLNKRLEFTLNDYRLLSYY